MKRIIISLAVVGAVAAAVVVGTTAFFSDTEQSTGNTITAGTIDLAVNGVNGEDAAVVNILDVKPSEQVADTEVLLNNVGSNDGVADLSIAVGTASEGTDSEPECVAEHGVWNNGSCDRANSGGYNLENICTMIEYDYTYDSNGNGIKDQDDMDDTLTAPGNIYLDVLPAGLTRKLWLSHHLSGTADNEYQGDTCAYNIEFSLHQLSGDPNSPVISFVDVGNTNSEDSKDMKGWGTKIWPAAGGNWGGGDDGTIRTVSGGNFDGYKTTYSDLNSATVEMDFGAVGPKQLTIRHLDGQATDDSFDVFVNSVLVGQYPSTPGGPEVWTTTAFSVPSAGGVQEVKIKLTGAHWTYYNDWGQLGVSWVKVTD